MQLQGPSCAGLPHKLWQTAPHLSASSTSSPHLWTSHLRPQLTHGHKSPGWELATVRLVFLIATMTIYTEAGHACLSVQTHMWEIRAVCSSVCTCVWLKEGMGLFRGFDKCVGGGGVGGNDSMFIFHAHCRGECFYQPPENLRTLGGRKASSYGKRGPCGIPATYSQAWPCG